MFGLILFVIAAAVFGYFYFTKPEFADSVKKGWVWLLATVAAVAAAVAAWFDKLPDVGV